MSMMMKTLRTVGAASVLVGGLFHLAGPAVFDLPLIGDAMSRIWNFGVGPATVQRLFGLVAVLSCNRYACQGCAKQHGRQSCA